jgi:hypothetical protein
VAAAGRASLTRPRSRLARGSLPTFVLGVVAATLLVLIQHSGRDANTGDSSGRAGAGRGALVAHENEAGGYTFMYPRGWHTQSSATMSKVQSPEDDVIVSFSAYKGRADPLRTARRLVDLVSHSYGRVRMGPVRIRAINGALAVLSFGRATNESRQPLRVVLAAILGGGRTLGVVGFESASTGVTPQGSVMEIVESLKVER